MSVRSEVFLTWIFRVVAAVILLQTLYFKFTGAPESVFIFSTLGVEPWGRILTGIMELIAAILILIPLTTLFGALLSMGIMGGALLSHIFVLGIAVQGDGGQLFIYAIIVFVCAAMLVFRKRSELFRFLPSK